MSLLSIFINPGNKLTISEFLIIFANPAPDDVIKIIGIKSLNEFLIISILFLFSLGIR